MSTNSTPTLSTLLAVLLPRLGVRRYWSLMDMFGSPEAMLTSDTETIPLDAQARSLIKDYQQQGSSSQLMQSAQRVIAQVDEQQGHIISIDSTDYPVLLKAIFDPPPLLYVKGNAANLALPQLAIVGSRHASHQGLQNTRMFSQHLAQGGFIITSGLALGVDGAAHQAVLSSEAEHRGKTIAVMATGIDCIYPKQHGYIAEQIVAEGGTLVTEFPPCSPPKANHFPRRNRIISGLSLGVLVIEAAIKSGSLITARCALDQGREVFAIPGSIHNPRNKGCHLLIKDGATLVESSQDIIEHLTGLIAHLRHDLPRSCHTGNAVATPQMPKPLDASEQQIMEHLGFEPMSIDQLIQSTQLSSQAVTTRLMNLQLKGRIKKSDWGYERLIPDSHSIDLD